MPLPGSVAGDPQLVPAGIVLDRGIIRARTDGTLSRHVDILIGIEGNGGRGIVAVRLAIVAGDSELVSVGAVLQRGVVPSARE